MIVVIGRGGILNHGIHGKGEFFDLRLYCCDLMIVVIGRGGILNHGIHGKRCGNGSDLENEPLRREITLLPPYTLRTG